MNKWVKPTLDTKFHIDADWWEEKGQNFRVHLLSHLCSECQERYKNYHEADLIDWIDVDTGEVLQVDGLWHSLRACCSERPDYINEMTPLTTAVFRTFLANGNEPLTSVELGEQLHRPAENILRTIGGFRVYHGIKPVAKKGGRRPLRVRTKESAP
ncbi:MAG TPA: hypothetical protein VLY63_30050 [Anaerolineae bacterium]|nr:hypothetical protein [Anaerolineae bacterium]